jgi:diguanylate cyclase (GGDEF)-like protein
MRRANFLRSTAFRGIVVYALVAVTLTVVFSVLVYENQLDLITENAFLRSVQSGLTVRQQIERLAKETDQWTDQVEQLFEAAVDTQSLTAFTESGEILASGGRSDTATSDNELLLIHRALTRRDFESRLITHELDRSGRLVSLYVPFEYPESQVGVLGLVVELSSIDEWTRILNRQALIVGILVMVIHTALALYAQRLFVTPLKQLVTATNTIAAGRYEVRLPEKREDEFGDLARSFRQMSHSVRQMHDDARSSNPLTGLPGNIEIERHIRHRMEGDRMYCVLYCDLDDFKAYNDTHGFAKGDEMILFVKDCLVNSATKVAKLPVFIGHEGGDDFVMVTDYSDWQRTAEEVIRLFEKGKVDFYSRESVAQGYVMAEDRRGSLVKHALVAISIAVVTNNHRSFEAFGEIVRVASEMKHLVKGKPGSKYAIDRRTE